MPKIRYFIAGLSWLFWLKSIAISQKDFWSGDKCLQSCRTHLVWLTVHFSPYFSVWLHNQEKKTTIPRKLTTQNLFAVLLDVELLRYILRLSKKPCFHASWHVTSGGTFKTQNKSWETWDKFTTIGNKFRNHIAWLSYGWHLSYDVLCSWQIIYGKLFGNAFVS